MYSAFYSDDRVLQVSPGTGQVSGKLQAIEQPSQKQNPILSEGNYIPPRVLGSMLMRHQTLWGRYE